MFAALLILALLTLLVLTEVETPRTDP